MIGRILLPAIVFCLGIAAGAQSQATQPPPLRATTPGQAAQPQRPPAISSVTRTVIVPVTVKDGQGQLVGDLTQADFRLFSDGVEQKIAHFSSDAVPLSTVVLIDDDLPDRAVTQVQKSLEAIAAGFGPSDEVALVTYDQYPNLVSDFSTNNDQLFTQLKRLDLGSHPTQIIADPTTAGPFINGQNVQAATPMPQHGSKRPENTDSLDDAIYAAGEMLHTRPRDRRKIIFLISDGSNSKYNHHTFDETLRMLLEADVSVYSISVTRSLPIGKLIAQPGISAIDKYATQTGGDTFYSSKDADLERLYSDVTEEARNEYTLTFYPEEADRTKDFHSIEVRVERPGLNVTARSGYYQSAIAAGR
ncbi:MAG TPA: VWA domain-containing protein [Candidatus Baltobacteraceae bacterium]|jgi:VWFA-related protein|nr:VWA domain-containing protein [Candidatus Baltobacteraceae bacterium]